MVSTVSSDDCQTITAAVVVDGGGGNGGNGGDIHNTFGKTPNKTPNLEQTEETCLMKNGHSLQL